MSQNGKRAKLVKLYFDVESTGQFPGVRDQCFAVGYAVSTSGKIVKSGRVCLKLAGPMEFIEHDAFSDNLADMFKTRGYDMECLQNFWAKNLDVFQRLQNDAVAENNMTYDERDFAREINNILLDVESIAQRWTIHFDTVAFDAGAINTILMRHGYPSLLYYRNGKYHKSSSYDIDSAVRGAYGHVPGEKIPDDSLFRQNEKAFEESLPKKSGPTLHMPDYDAEKMAKWFDYMFERSPAKKATSGASGAENKHSPKRMSPESDAKNESEAKRQRA